MNFKKILSTAITGVFLLSFATLFPTDKMSAATTDYKFDFGSGGTQSGYIGVSATDGYSSSKGYGFNTPSNMANVSASGSGALSDAVQFKTHGTNSNNTFNVDLPNGLYQITITLGNTNRTSIAAEGVYQIMNMTGNNAKDTFQIPITDGQLNILATPGKEGYAYTMSALEIYRISDNPEMAPTIWLCGDSTVCNYYPLATSAQGGWGQMLNQFVDSKFQVRNMATGGQYAKGFMDSGQFDAIMKYIKPGDYYFISIGINDTNYSNTDEYYTTIKSMAQQAMDKGAKVILVAQQGRVGDISNSVLNENSGRWFSGTLKTIASEMNIQCVDLYKLYYNYCKSIGQSATTALYMTDGLHPNHEGATKLAGLVALDVDFSGETTADTVVGEEIATDYTYMIKNSKSGLYLNVNGGVVADNTNVDQLGANGPQKQNLWKLESAGDGYYYIYSQVGDGKTYLLDVAYAKAENGTNIGIYSNTNSDAQLFKFYDNGDGTYVILTKVSASKSCLGVLNGSTEPNANVLEWEYIKTQDQKWILETAQVQSEIADKIEILGDLNKDGKLNAFDMIYYKKHNFNESDLTARDQSDFNADGSVNALDYKIMSNYLIGKSSEFVPIEKLFYAKDAEFFLGIKETTNAGFKSDSYLNLNNVKGSYAKWSLDIPDGGNYLVTFRVANGSAVNRVMKMEVNDNLDYWLQDFLPTESWTNWADRGIVLPLKAGVNTIKVTSNVAEGAPNIDYIKLVKTEEPVAPVYIPETTPVIPENETPVIYIAGDSTVQTYRASYAPQQGWGAYLDDYFTDNVTVSNQAIAGRSSKSFIENGRLDTILSTIKKGDYLMVQFGINDSAVSNPERYAPVGDINKEGTFNYYIKQYIEGALEKGATPILVTTTLSLKSYSNGKFVNSYSNYCNAMKEIAVAYKIPCIDLNSLMVEHYNSIGYDKAYYYHLLSTPLSTTDMTHFTETGANAVARLVVNEMRKLNIPISQLLK